jgi:uncharacterized cupin superfamily protein
MKTPAIFTTGRKSGSEAARVSVPSLAVHDSDELVMLVEGEEEFEMNERKYRLQIGEELLIPAGTAHTARNIGKTTSKWLYGYKRQ